jgi:DNA adenine methylase
MQNSNDLNEGLKPFLQWAGGKRQLLHEIRKYIPNNINTYYEPFIGAGAVLFDLKPTVAVINDFNTELIDCYDVIKNSVYELIEDLKKHINTKEYYYNIRNIDRTAEYQNFTKVEKASRLIYLNKTCFNALYRVNSKGYYNTPFADRKNPLILEEKTLLAINTYFSNNNIVILNGEFSEAIKDAKAGDFVYLDPPYDPVSDSSSFTSYSTSKFGKEKQIELCNTFKELHERGCKLMLSNSYTDFILDLYKDFNILTVEALRTINSNGDKRGKVNEVLVLNYNI